MLDKPSRYQDALRSLMRAMLIGALAVCAAACMGHQLSTDSATTQSSGRETASLRLLGPQSEATVLNWEQRTPRLSWGRAFRAIEVDVVTPSSRRFNVSAVNAFAIAREGVITNVNVRPDWPKGTGAQVTERIEKQLEAWGVKPAETERAQLEEFRKMGIPQGPSGMWGYPFRLGDDVVFSVRIQSTRGEGWFAVFEFGVPLERQPK